MGSARRFFLIFFFLIPVSAEARWDSLRIPGGIVRSVSVSPADNKTFLALSDYRVWKTTDAGQHWTAVSTYLRPQAAAFAPNSSGRAYFLSVSGNLYRSLDSGSTWTANSSAVAQYYHGDGGLAVDPSDDDIVYSAGYSAAAGGDIDHGVYRSNDAGASWTMVKNLDTPGTGDSGEVITGIVSPDSDKVVFITNINWGDSGAIYYSQDGGRNWENPVETSEGQAFTFLAYNPYEKSHLYALARDSSFNYRLYYSRNYGQSWSYYELNNPLYSLAFTGYDGSYDQLIGCDESYCYSNAESGDPNGYFGWMDQTRIDSSVSSLYPGVFYAGGDIYVYDLYGAGIYKNTGSSLSSFSSFNGDYSAVNFEAMSRDGINTGVLYSASQSDLYVSTAPGASWITLTPAAAGSQRAGVKANSEALLALGNKVYIARGDMLYTGERSGETSFSWSEFSFSADAGLSNPGDISDLAAGSEDGQILYAAFETPNPGPDTGLYKSEDGGASWAKDNDLGDKIVSRVTVSTATGLVYAVVYEDGNSYDERNSSIYRLSGGSWADVSVPVLPYSSPVKGEIHTLILDDSQPGTVYAANEWYLFKSTDEGLSWSIKFSDANGDLKKILLSSGAGYPKTLYAALSDTIYASINGGDSWNLVGSGFSGVKALAEGSLYAATSEGMYRSDIAASAVSTLTYTVLASTSSSGSSVSVNLPPEAFGPGVTVLVSVFDAGSLSFSDSLIRTSSLGLSIQTNISTQPAREVELVFNYSPSDIAGLDESRLVVARLTGSGGYELLPSTADPAGNRVISSASHFSSFALVQYTPLSSPSFLQPLAYPVPFDPSRHTAGMTVEKLLPGSEARIYTITGQLVRKLEADSSGKTVWNGKNDAGRTAASGIYLMVVKDESGRSRKIKLAVEK